ncbi:hypothetical protein IWX87_001142 [Polaromonas sp. CG_9.7]|nr:hypothetical protein [Polaromonas sp. CG_9.7]MBG6113389.1 hypothetical protein [Polaromonas sp. CG_9.2]MDH6183153.1 hypothetical protein [Polaromonas sp. CG_23.6]
MLLSRQDITSAKQYFQVRGNDGSTTLGIGHNLRKIGVIPNQGKCKKLLNK